MSTYTINSFGSIGVPQTLPLHIEGSYIKDDLGRVVYLRGVVRVSFTDDSTGWWQPEGGNAAEGLGHWDETAVRLHLQQIQDLGINVIRLIICVDWWKNNLATTLSGAPADRPYRDSIKNTIRLAEEYGIYVVFTAFVVRLPGHQDSYPWAHETDPNGEVIDTPDDWINFWVDVSTQLKSYSNVLYELWNEPVGPSEVEFFSEFQRAIDAIRANGDDHIIIAHWGYCGYFDWMSRNPLNDPAGNILYSNHIYRQPPGSTMDPGQLYQYDDIKNQLLNYWNYTYMLDNNLPIFIGEIGAWYGIDPNELVFFNNTLTILNEWGASYTAMVWDRPDMVWALQQNTLAPFPLNDAGQILIDAIAAAKT